MLNDQINQLEIENTKLRDLLQKQMAENRLKAGFLAAASHALRSPLTSIQLSSCLIELYYNRLDKQKILVHLDKIKCAVSQSVSIMDNYLLTETAEKTE